MRGPFGIGSCRMSRSSTSWPAGWASEGQSGGGHAKAWDAGNEESGVAAELEPGERRQDTNSGRGLETKG